MIESGLGKEFQKLSSHARVFFDVNDDLTGRVGR